MSPRRRGELLKNVLSCRQNAPNSPLDVFCQLALLHLKIHNGMFHSLVLPLPHFNLLNGKGRLILCVVYSPLDVPAEIFEICKYNPVLHTLNYGINACINGVHHIGI